MCSDILLLFLIAIYSVGILMLITECLILSDVQIMNSYSEQQ